MFRQNFQIPEAIKIKLNTNIFIKKTVEKNTVEVRQLNSNGFTFLFNKLKIVENFKKYFFNINDVF